MDLIPDREERNEVLQEIARLRANVNVEEALAWLETLPPEDRPSAWSGGAREWARIDPRAAAELAASMEEPLAQEQLISA